MEIEMIKIRKATLKDMKSICDIEMSSGYHKKKFDFQPYLKKIFDEKAEIFCAKEKEHFIGYITLDKKGEVGYLAVSKNYQNKGIASLLINKVIHTAKNKKIKKLFLDVKNDNTSAILFYTKNGFVVTKVYSYRSKFEKKKITKLRMEKTFL
jgi:[ribosomal protein S18]-alanine N-acetyltransferase